MPFEITFNAKLLVRDEDQYFNDCCWGGDVIQEQLLPAIEAKYPDIQANQEDWGWFIWTGTSKLNLAIDIFCVDKDEGKFRVRISASKKGLLSFGSVKDNDHELVELKSLVADQLQHSGYGIQIVSVPSD